MNSQMRNLTTLPPSQHPPRPRKGSTGPFARARRVAGELTPDAIEQIAQRVVQLLHHQPLPTDEDPSGSPDLIDAEQLARRLGVTRAWVYENAGKLGAIPLNDGPRPRLRFDLVTATQAFQARQRRNEPTAPPETPRPGPTRRRRLPSTVPLLPVHEPRTRGIFSRWRRADRREH
jgi:hypothetical protein